MNIAFYDFYGDDAWPDVPPHTIKGFVDKVTLHPPSLNGPLQVEINIRAVSFDSGTYDALRKLSRGVASLVERPEATVLLYYDPEDESS